MLNQQQDLLMPGNISGQNQVQFKRDSDLTEIFCKAQLPCTEHSKEIIWEVQHIPCPLLYVSKWVHSMNMNTEHVYCLFLRMWLGKQKTVLTLWPLQHASSYKTSLVIASYRILKRTFNRYGDMVGTHKEEKMWKEEKRNLRGESDDNFQGLCTTCCNFYEKLEKKKE